MTTELTPSDPKKQKVEVNVQNSSPSPVYGIGLIGAWVYFFKRATTPEERFKAFFKGFAWPALLVYQLFKFLEPKSE